MVWNTRYEDLELVLRNEKMYKSYAFRLCGNVHTADDLFQEAMIRTRNVEKDLPKIFYKAIYRSWQDDRRKKYGRYHKAYFHNETDLEKDLSMMLVEEPDSSFEEQDSVDHLLSELTQRDQRIIYEHVVEERSKAEVSRRYDLSDARIGQICSKAFETLRSA
jgi:RNA polymerase sigma factor (sigma-70 family)